MDSLVNYLNHDKIANLKEILEDYDSLLVAFSGGIDSGFLLKASLDFLGSEEVLAVTSTGAIYPDSELEDAKEFVDELDANWRKIERNPIENHKFRSNPENRCYYCKLGLFQELKKLAEKEGFNEIADGSISDDLSGHRPGRIAGDELEVKRPLEEAGLTKKDIRSLSKKLGLPGWNKPSNSCLATRIPYSSKVTKEKLRKIARSEAALRELGFQGFRVRHHGGLARIEFQPDDLNKAIDDRKSILEKLREIGFTYVALDLEGYRTGSLLEASSD